MSEKPQYILDNSPLTTLCRFPSDSAPYIHTVFQYMDIILPHGVIKEARGGTGIIARVALPLLNRGIIQSMVAPLEPAILDLSYGSVLGQGEREVIKIALKTGNTPIIDDKQAFIAACRFGLHPLGFQDLLVRLVNECGFPRLLASEIAKTTARQFPAIFLLHTLSMLDEVK